jgi:DNA polymerase-3 subunit alpha
MQQSLRDVNASNVEDLIAVAALYRPGPMDYIPQYAEGKRHPESIKYAHPIIEKHLSVTYGIMVYQ